MSKYLFRAFTLVELVIVIAIISILLSVGLNLSWNNIDKAFARNEKQQFLERYDNILHQTIRTKRHQKKEYTKISLDFTSGSNIINQRIWYKNTGHRNERYQLDKMFVAGDQRNDNTMKISLTPYNFDCHIQDKNNHTISQTGSFILYLPGSSVRYCFMTQPHTCKLQEISCEGHSSK